MSLTFLSFHLDAPTVLLVACGSLTVSALAAMLPARGGAAIWRGSGGRARSCWGYWGSS